MRNLLAVSVVIGLLTAPSLGAVDIKLTVDKASIVVGETTTVRLLAQGNTAGVMSAGGYVAATGTAGALTSVADSFAWVPGFLSPSPFPAKVGTAGANGGWGTVGTVATGFGSMQATFLAPSATLGSASFVELASYKVTGAAMGQVTLAASPTRISGFKLVATDDNKVLGANTPVTIAVRKNGDVNGDTYVNVGDLQALVAAWGSGATPPSGNWNANGDLNGDGYINVGDLQGLVANWGL